MPELPEVETTRRGIEPHLQGQTIVDLVVRQPSLRWPVPDNLLPLVKGHKVKSVMRRAKYLLLELEHGFIVIHLGMSGSLRLTEQGVVPEKHDHVDLQLSSGQLLRYTDPRRFGAVLWIGKDEMQADQLNPQAMGLKLLAGLGPEPIVIPGLHYEDEQPFSGDYLYQRSRGKTSAVKTFIMDSHVVVGVGNIYANEALFMAGIHPSRAAGRVSRVRYQRLAEAIQQVLSRAIEQGGTTLKDFVGGDGKPGYFKQELQVYGRAGEPCNTCGEKLKEIRIGQRSTVFCRTCQR